MNRSNNLPNCMGNVAALAMLMVAGAAHASDPPPAGFIAAGLATAPDFEGSSDYQPVPFFTARLHSGRVNVEFEGLSARLHLKPPSWFEAGLLLNYHFGRDDDIENGTVGRLAEVDDAVEAGAFFRVELDNQWQEQDSIAFQIEPLWDTGDAHGGNLIVLSTSYGFALGNRFRFELGAQTTYADRDYMRTYFGVDSDTVGTSGLPAHDTSSGLKDAGVSLNSVYFFSKRIGVLGRMAYTRLTSDTADSPIVQQQGDSNQLFTGLSVMYRF